MAISWDSFGLELLKIYFLIMKVNQWKDIYIYIWRERVKNALFISLMKIYGRFQTVKQLILKHCCWLLLPPLTSSFWGLWMTWYVLTLRFVPKCEIFVSVCHYCWNIWCCFQWRVVVYMFIYLQIKTSGTFHMKWKHLRSLLSPKFIFLFIFHRTEFFSLDLLHYIFIYYWRSNMIVSSL